MSFFENFSGTLLLAWTVIGTSMVHAQVSVLTWHNDNARTGQNLQESTLTPSNVNSSTFGRLLTLTVDGKVDAQPLYVPLVVFPGAGPHNVVYVVTENDSVYAFDADNGSLLKQVALLQGTGEVPSDNRGCGQVTPEIGITATPVIDPLAGPHGTIYLVAMSKDTSGKYHHRVHALDITTLMDELPAVEVAASVPGSNPDATFTAAVHKERPGLLLSDGVVYTTWGSHCDSGSYSGWVIGYNQYSLAQVKVLNLTPNGSDGGIWSAGAGPAADSSGNIFLLTGNGAFDTTLASGFPSKGDYGNAFVKMSATGPLAVTDYFTMQNTTSESSTDTDLGSGGLMLLPPLNDAQGHPRSLVVGAGKDANIYVLDQTNLGKFSPGSDNIFQQMTGVLPGGVWSSPAWFNGTLYYGDSGSPLKAFPFANGQFATTASSHSATSFEYPGTTPSISANGTSNAIVWAAENSASAVLHAYNATNLSQELYNSNQAANSHDHFGSGNKYIVPTVANGKVYVGTTSGVGMFGLLAQPADFSVGATPGSKAILAGSTATYTIAMIPTNTFNESVSFSASGLPAGATAMFNPHSITGSGSTTLTIATSPSGGTGPFTISVDASGGGINHQASTSLSIQHGEDGPGTNVGVFRSGQFWLDTDNDFAWTGSPDRFLVWGEAGDIPIIGDWDNTGVRRIGVFRNGQWFLDIDNNGVWDPEHDLAFLFGQAGDVPLIADWDGSGIQRIGVFRNGQWWVDINGDHQWDALHDQSFFYGQAGDVPIVGDWDNSGRQRIGVFRSGQWWLDMNGDRVWDAIHDMEFSYGQSGDTPVVGDWTRSGETRIGVVRAAQWWLDMNGDHVWDPVNDRVFFFGLPSDVPVVAQ